MTVTRVGGFETVQALTGTSNISNTAGSIVTYAGAAGQTLTLPAAGIGSRFHIYNIDASDAVTIARNGADTINGATSFSLAAGDSVELLCLAAGVWSVIGGSIAERYAAGMSVANSGAPTHTSNGGYQKVGSGGGTVTWTSLFDVRPPGVAAQLDLATNKRIDIKYPGIYKLIGRVSILLGTTTSTCNAAVYVNGSNVGTINGKPQAVAGPTNTVEVNGLYPLVPGDYVELFGYQNESASEGYTVSSSFNNFLEIARVA